METLKKNGNAIAIYTLVFVNTILIISIAGKLFQRPDIEASIPEDAEPLKVEVLNGCGQSGVANEFSDILQYHQYVIVDVGNADAFDYEKTVILDRGKRSDNVVKKLQSDLGIGDDLVYKIRNEGEAEATVIIGEDYQSLKAYRAIH